MISRLTVRYRWLRRSLSRTRIAARLLGVPRPVGEADLPGLILFQVDGLSRRQFEKALKGGRLPFLANLIRRKHFNLETFYSGIPSTTPAVQAEIFYGVRRAVPAFQFLHRESGEILKMMEAPSAARIESELAASGAKPLLEGGSGYSNIYRAGAAFTRYCSEDLAADEMMRRTHPLKWLAIGLLFAPKILRMVGLAVLEFFIALIDAVNGLYQREHFKSEMKFVLARALVCILLREAIRFRMMMDVECGVQVIHGNLLGYDEQAHRRGPDSAFAHWTLKGIDSTIRDVYRAMNASDYRDYEIIVYSDHGQERVVPYARRHGRELKEALDEVFSQGPLAGESLWTREAPTVMGLARERVRALRGLPTEPSLPSRPELGANFVVAAMGPIGHLYFPRRLSEEETGSYAADLFARAGIPLVLWPRGNGEVSAINSRGFWTLPRDRAEVLGADHPFLDEAAEDLVALCFQRDAGDLVISGWDPPHPPLSFPMENGAHGGPGSEETRGFLLVPDRIRRWHQARMPTTGSRVRGEDLRRVVLHFLGRDGETREERVAEQVKRAGKMPLRVMTYNIHSCVGLDGKVRPERIARVINHYDPDLVAVQEVDCHRLRSRGADQAQILADHLRMTHVFHAMFEEERERYGIAVFSRYPFSTEKVGYLTEADPVRFVEARGAIWLRVEPEGGKPFHFVNTHLGIGRRERRIQVETLMGGEWLGSIPDSEPVVLCGDFNTVPRSPVYRKLRQRFHDAQLLAPGHAPRATFTSVRPFLRIDHVLVSPHFSVQSVERPDTPTAKVASDHLPLSVELVLR